MQGQAEAQQIPKKHHYIPQFYLLNFSQDNKKLHILDKKATTPELMFRHQSVEAIAYETHLYTYKTKQGGKETLEGFFSEIEGQAKYAIHKLSEREILTLDERSWLSLFVSLLKLRTPANKHETLGADQAMREKMIRMNFHAPKEIVKKLYLKKDHTLTEKEVDEAIEFARDEKRSKLVIEYPSGYWIKRMLLLANDLSPVIASFEWEIRHADKQFAFLTSDDPFLLIPSEKPHPFYGVGLITYGAKKILPLTANLCLVMHEPKEEPILYHSEADKVFFKFINECTVRHANRFVYSPEKGKIEKIAKTKKELLKPWENMFSVS